MDKINKDIIYNILSERLRYNDLLNLCLADRYVYNIVKLLLKRKKIEEKKEKISNLFPEEIINIVGMDKFLAGKNVPWNIKWLGGTDYIDHVELEDLTNSLSYGQDCYKRSFIFGIFEKEGKKSTITLFQRYTNDNFFVTVGSSDMERFFITSRCGITKPYAEDLQLLFSDKKDFIFVKQHIR